MHKATPSGGYLNASMLGTGKANPVSEPILTPGGWKVMGDVQAGDYVVGSDGKPTKVLSVHPQGEQEIVEVTFTDGSKSRCTWDHLWTVRRPKSIFDKEGWLTLSTRELVERGLYNRYGNRQYFIPMVKPVEYTKKQTLPLDPYFLGVLIGDGSLSGLSTRVSTDHTIVKSLKVPEGVTFTLQRDKGYSGDYNIQNAYSYLDTLGLRGTVSNNKFIPDQYMYGTPADRLALLQGLFDTDGTACGAGIDYGTVSRVLAYQVKELVQSLGGTATLTTKLPTYSYKGEKRVGQLYYRMRVKLPQTPFRLKRKLDRYQPRSKYPITRGVVSINPVGREEAQCIKVASKDSLYVTRDFILTHNTATTVQYLVESKFKTALLIVPLGTRIGWERHLKMMGWEHPIHRIESANSNLDKLADGESGAYIIGREYFTLIGTEGWTRWERGKPAPASLKRHLPEGVEFTEENVFEHLDIETKTVPGSGKTYHYATIRKQLVDWEHAPVDVTVYDEVHRLQNRKSESFKAIAKHQPPMKIGLSGTPSGNKFQGFYGVTKWLWPDIIPDSYWNWGATWARVVHDPFTFQKVEEEREPGAFVQSLPGYYRLESNLDTELHENQLIVELSPKQRKLYEQMEEDAVAWLEEHPLIAEIPITKRIRLRQITLGVPSIVEDDVVDYKDNCASSKLDALQEFIRDNPDEPLLILLDSAKFAKIAAKRLGKHARPWTGDNTQREREEMLRGFGHEFKYLVATIPAIGEGVDGLQRVCNHVIWLSRSENSILNEQAAGRLYRTGQTKPVHSIDIIAENTYDEGVLSRTLELALQRNASAAKEQLEAAK